jgi:hypothetical protein
MQFKAEKIKKQTIKLHYIWQYIIGIFTRPKLMRVNEEFYLLGHNAV